VIADEKLQRFFEWLGQKSKLAKTSPNSIAIRAFYCAFVLNRAIERTHIYRKYRTQGFDDDFDRFYSLVLDKVQDEMAKKFYDLTRKSFPAQIPAYDRALRAAILVFNLALGSFKNISDFTPIETLDYSLISDLGISTSCGEDKFMQRLQQLGNELSALDWQDRTQAKQWLQSSVNQWEEQLRQAIIEHSNIDQSWQFSDRQEQQLVQYYEANKLLVECLNSECYVSRSVREEIEATLLLPME
jgi:hypothetical protein